MTKMTNASKHNLPSQITCKMDYFTNTCRVCMSRDVKLINLYHNDDDMYTFIDKLNICVPEIFTEENYMLVPDTLCEPCCRNLKIAFSFRELCIKTNVYLREEKCRVEKELHIKVEPKHDEENKINSHLQVKTKEQCEDDRKRTLICDMQSKESNSFEHTPTRELMTHKEIRARGESSLCFTQNKEENKLRTLPTDMVSWAVAYKKQCRHEMQRKEGRVAKVRKFCRNCYENNVKAFGTRTAKNCTKKVTTYCGDCKGQPHFCLPCFNKLHRDL